MLEAKGEKWWTCPEKRALDCLVASAFLLPGTLPLIVTAGLIYAYDRQTPFINLGQIVEDKRYSKSKLRTMLLNAADMELIVTRGRPNSDAKGDNEKTDPRITPIGRILRPTGFDEYPQFWDILRGHTSFVGPRIPSQSEFDNFIIPCSDHEPYSTFLANLRKGLKPGLISAYLGESRNVPLIRKLEIENSYAEEACFKRDVQVVAQAILTCVILRK